MLNITDMLEVAASFWRFNYNSMFQNAGHFYLPNRVQYSKYSTRGRTRAMPQIFSEKL
jgi:hypothetical protein